MNRAFLELAVLVVMLVPTVSLAEEIVIEDRIGDPTSTSGNTPIFSSVNVQLITVSKIFSATPVRLTRIEVVGSSAAGIIENGVSADPWDVTQNWRMAIHSTEEHARSNPMMGDVVQELRWSRGLPDSIPMSYSPLAADSFGIQTHLFHFDLRQEDFPEVFLSGNANYWLVLSDEQNGGEFHWTESEFPGESDFLMGWNDSWQFVFAWDGICGWSNGSCNQSGRIAFKLIGETLPDPGDYDRDGDVDGRDFLVWQRGDSPNPLSAEDLAAWQSNFGAGSPLAAVAVPEPSSLLLVAALAHMILRRSVVA